jgi:hypothetical protein
MLVSALPSPPSQNAETDNHHGDIAERLVTSTTWKLAENVA